MFAPFTAFLLLIWMFAPFTAFLFLIWMFAPFTAFLFPIGAQNIGAQLEGESDS
jgi:hypothetical protein